MVMLDTNRELQVTTMDYKSFAFRLSPSYRVFKFIKTDKFGKPDSNEQRAVRVADILGDGLEAIIDRGYLRKSELRDTVYPLALGFSELEPLKHSFRGKVIYQRILVAR